jgi:hypothetical protein
MSHQAWAVIEEPLAVEGGFGHGAFGHGAFGHGPPTLTWEPITIVVPAWEPIAEPGLGGFGHGPFAHGPFGHGPMAMAWTPVLSGDSGWALIDESILGWGLQEWGTSPWGGGTPVTAWQAEDQPL